MAAATVRSGKHGWRLAVLLVLATGAAACLWLNLPGHLSYDSVLQLAQGRAGVYNTWHPPVMAWLLGLGDRLVRGVALFVGFEVLLAFGGLALFALAGRPRWLTCLLAAACCASPQLSDYPAVVWKDVLFAGVAVCVFGCLAVAGAAWERTRWRRAWIVLSWLLAVLAALTRQNGAVLLPVAAASLALIVGHASLRGPRLRGALVAGGAYLGAAVVAVALASAALNTRADGEPARLHQVEDLQTYDIVGALKSDPTLRLEVLHASAPALERQLRTKGLAAYTPERIDPIVAMPGLARERDENMEVLGAQWRELVRQHPLIYLKGRARLFRWVVLTPDLDACIPVYTGVDGDELELSQLGLKPRASDRDVALESYERLFVGTPVLSHLFYAIVGAVLLAWFMVRRRLQDYAAAGLLASAFLFTATFFVLSVACDYRYLYVLDLSVMAAGLYASATLRAGRAARPQPTGRRTTAQAA